MIYYVSIKGREFQVDLQDKVGRLVAGIGDERFAVDQSGIGRYSHVLIRRSQRNLIANAGNAVEIGIDSADLNIAGTTGILVVGRSGETCRGTALRYLAWQEHLQTCIGTRQNLNGFTDTYVGWHGVV